MNTTIRELIEYLYEIDEDYYDIPLSIDGAEIDNIQIECHEGIDCNPTVELLITALIQNENKLTLY